MLSANAVSGALYDFTINALRKFSTNKNPVDLASAEWLFSTFRDRPCLTLEDIESMSAVEARALYEIVSQYIIFLILFPDLLFPEDFLLGTSSSSLGVPVLQYMAEHRFPLPTMPGKVAH